MLLLAARNMYIDKSLGHQFRFPSLQQFQIPWQIWRRSWYRLIYWCSLISKHASVAESFHIYYLK